MFRNEIGFSSFNTVVFLIDFKIVKELRNASDNILVTNKKALLKKSYHFLCE